MRLQINFDQRNYQYVLTHYMSHILNNRTAETQGIIVKTMKCVREDYGDRKAKVERMKIFADGYAEGWNNAKAFMERISPPVNAVADVRPGDEVGAESDG